LIAVDANVLVYAHRSEFPEHEVAVERLRGLAEGRAAWGLPVFAIGEFLRVVTHPRILRPPSSLEAALAAMHELLASPSCRVLYPGPAYWGLLREALLDSKGSGNLVFDAQIVAVCVEHGATRVLTEDRDFRRFRAVDVEVLVGPSDAP
jgi:uncharacterized protein